jgi:hypothetical protein
MASMTLAGEFSGSGEPPPPPWLLKCVPDSSSSAQATPTTAKMVQAHASWVFVVSRVVMMGRGSWCVRGWGQLCYCTRTGGGGDGGTAGAGAAVATAVLGIDAVRRRPGPVLCAAGVLGLALIEVRRPPQLAVVVVVVVLLLLLVLLVALELLLLVLRCRGWARPFLLFRVGRPRLRRRPNGAARLGRVVVLLPVALGVRLVVVLVVLVVRLVRMVLLLEVWVRVRLARGLRLMLNRLLELSRAQELVVHELGRVLLVLLLVVVELAVVILLLVLVLVAMVHRWRLVLVWVGLMLVLVLVLLQVLRMLQGAAVERLRLFLARVVDRAGGDSAARMLASARHRRAEQEHARGHLHGVARCAGQRQ